MGSVRLESPLRKSALDALVSPETQAALRLQSRAVSGDEVREGALCGPGVSYPIREGIPSFVDGRVSEDQTIRSFSQKWAKHRYYREHTRRFYTDWYLARYGFGDLYNGLADNHRQYSSHHEFHDPHIHNAHCGTGCYSHSFGVL